VRVRVLVDTLKNVVTVPPAVVQRSSDGPFVWVIKPDNTVENRPITAGPSDDNATVVASGLKPGERVVIRGQYRLRPGSKVDPREREAPIAEKLAP
jgi:multidrug efflux system membrane fusion protein